MDEQVVQALTHTLELLSRQVESPPEVSVHTPDVESPPGRVRGRLQQAIVDLPGMVDPGGMRAAEISAEIDYSISNTYRLLQSLARSAIAELVPGPGSQRWRLTKSHRYGPSVFIRLVELVRPGEWTSCGDVSIAARGDIFTAWMVCWAADRLPDFPHPHRVLLEGGVLHPYGHDHQRRRPEEVRDRLVAEGMSFSRSASASPARRVPWDQLRRRDATQGRLQTTPTTAGPAALAVEVDRWLEHEIPRDR